MRLQGWLGVVVRRIKFRLDCSHDNKKTKRDFSEAVSEKKVYGCRIVAKFNCLITSSKLAVKSMQIELTTIKHHECGSSL